MNQSASKFLMIRPAVFGFNPETCRTNHYQRPGEGSAKEIYAQALAEFEALYGLYKAHDIEVVVFDNPDTDVPDAIFPNSFSTFDDGGVVLHPMLEKSRQRERSADLVRYFTDDLGYRVKADMTHWEAQGRALEGTGSLVMDHANRVAYMGISERSNLQVAQEYAGVIGYELVAFRTRDHHGIPIYHTDVLMYIGTGYAGICLDCIHEEERDMVRGRLGTTHELIVLTMAQLRAFCGNALEMCGRGGEKFLAMSDTAFAAMTDAQKEAVERHGVRIIHSDVSVIERNGGGSVRCMTQELF